MTRAPTVDHSCDFRIQFTISLVHKFSLFSLKALLIKILNESRILASLESSPHRESAVSPRPSSAGELLTMIWTNDVHASTKMASGNAKGAILRF